MTRTSLPALFALGLLALPNVGGAGSLDSKGALPLTCRSRLTGAVGTGHAGLNPNGDVTGSVNLDQPFVFDETLVCELFCVGDSPDAPYATSVCGAVKKGRKSAKFAFKRAAVQEGVPDPCRIPAVVVSTNQQLTCGVGWHAKH